MLIAERPSAEAVDRPIRAGAEDRAGKFQSARALGPGPQCRLPRLRCGHVPRMAVYRAPLWPEEECPRRPDKRGGRRTPASQREPTAAGDCVAADRTDCRSSSNADGQPVAAHWRRSPLGTARTATSSARCRSTSRGRMMMPEGGFPPPVLVPETKGSLARLFLGLEPGMRRCPEPGFCLPCSGWR